jgi:hypothetical protein
MPGTLAIAVPAFDDLTYRRHGVRRAANRPSIVRLVLPLPFPGEGVITVLGSRTHHMP